MTRNYKTGPARSRRRPDPSSRVLPGQTVAPLEAVTIDTGAGQVAFNVTIHNPTNGEDWDGAEWVNTNLPSRAFFIDSASTVHPLSVTGQPGGSGFALGELTGLPAGVGQFIIPGGDPSVRSIYGDWIGTLWAEHTVT